jgi:hypothetical protein
MIPALLAAIVTMQFHVTQPEPRERVLVTGATGEGKSVYTGASVDPVWRKLIFDPEREEAFARYRWWYVDELEQRWRELRHGSLALVIRERPGAPVYGADSEHERFCAVVWKIGESGSPLLSVHEEAGAWSEGAGPSQTGYHFAQLTTRGRKRGVSMLVTAQRVYQVPTVYRDNLSRLIAYQVPNEKAVHALEEICGRDGAALLEQLGDHEFIEWTRKERARIRRPLAVPE